MVRPARNKSKKKSQNSNLSFRVSGILKRLVLTSLSYIFSMALLGLLFWAVTAYAMTSPAFGLQEVKVLNARTMTPEQSFAFTELHRGENLVTLDIVAVQQVIKTKFPEFKEVIVKRVLPSRVEVLLKRRTPVAQVAYSRYVQIDKDLVVLPAVNSIPFRNLTIIEGSKLPSPGLIVGATIKDEATRKALKLKEIIERASILRGHELTKIDISDPKSISLIVDAEIEIKMGNSHILERLKLLDQTLRTLTLDPAKIRYIDLRFDDVVVSPR